MRAAGFDAASRSSVRPAVNHWVGTGIHSCVSLRIHHSSLAITLGLLTLCGLAAGCAESTNSEPLPVVGRACEHDGALPSDLSEPLVTPEAAACDGDPCLLALALVPPSAPCVDDAACNAGGSISSSQYRCQEGACVVAEAIVLERSMCAPVCESQADCDAVDDGSTCVSGFTCAHVVAEGPLCCLKQCVCNDDLSAAASTDLERDCAADAAALCGA